MKRQQQVLQFIFRVTILLPLAAVAQTAQQPKTDTTDNKQQIESSTVNLKTAANTKLDASLRIADTTLLITLKGSGIGTASIDATDEAVFVLDNDSSVIAKSVGFQGFESKDFVNSYKHDYIISREALQTLSQHNLRRVRRYTLTEHKDIFLDEPNAGNLRALSASFLQELSRIWPARPKLPSTMPAFPGGRDVFLSFLNRNLKLQANAVEGRKQAVVQFQVGADGSVSDMQILQSAGAPYDNELLRILKRMPKWKPALEDGNRTEAVVVQQVTFSRQGAAVSVQF